MSIPAYAPPPQPCAGPWGAQAAKHTVRDTQVPPATTTPEVDAIGAMPFTGTLVPHAWYTALTLPSGKPDLVAITLLADIVYWYRPVVERDPATGEILRQRKKFRADMLQRSYQAFANQFGFTKRQVMEAMYRLEKTYGVIRKVLRHLDTPYGRCANVLFVAPIPATLQAITWGRERSHTRMGDVSRSTGTRLTLHCKTNTESTPESSQEIPPLKDDFSSLLSEEAEEVLEEETAVTANEDEVPDEVPAEQTAAPLSFDTSPPAGDGSPPASPAVIIPLFPGQGTQHPPSSAPRVPVAPPVHHTSRDPTTPVSTPAPALPWWADAQQAQQDEAHWRVQFAALPVAQQAQHTQQARQVLTRQGVPAWMQIGPVVAAAVWELQHTAGATGSRMSQRHRRERNDTDTRARALARLPAPGRSTKTGAARRGRR